MLSHVDDLLIAAWRATHEAIRKNLDAIPDRQVKLRGLRLCAKQLCGGGGERHDHDLPEGQCGRRGLQKLDFDKEAQLRPDLHGGSWRATRGHSADGRPPHVKLQVASTALELQTFGAYRLRRTPPMSRPVQ